MKPSSPSKSKDRILFLLKTKGNQSAAELARRMKLTPMGVRQHLTKLLEAGLVAFSEQRQAVGRPKQIWSLTRSAQGRFPESYAELAVDLLVTVRQTLGAKALDTLLEERTRHQVIAYRKRAAPKTAPLAERVLALTKLRKAEGYMATWSKTSAGFTLTENHCPVCAAAQVCQSLCAAELHLFQETLGPDVSVTRTEHLLLGARRCVYEISHKS